MATDVLDARIVFVKDPSVLPTDVPHHKAIEDLSSTSEAVILLSHGNQYVLPKTWVKPANVTFIEYDIENTSIEKCVVLLRELLRSLGIDVHSRHLAGQDPMPIPLAGACLVVNVGTTVSFINSQEQYTAALLEGGEDPETQPSSDWDIL